MFIIYQVTENADKTEGRGPMVPVAAFRNKHDAEHFVDRREGVMGRLPKEGLIAYNRRFGNYLDHAINEVKVWDTLAEYSGENDAAIAKRALAKLTDEERRVLKLLRD